MLFVDLARHVWITTDKSEPGSGDATALMSNAKSFPSIRTGVGQMHGRGAQVGAPNRFERWPRRLALPATRA